LRPCSNSRRSMPTPARGPSSPPHRARRRLSRARPGTRPGSPAAANGSGGCLRGVGREAGARRFSPRSPAPGTIGAMTDPVMQTTPDRGRRAYEATEGDRRGSDTGTSDAADVLRSRVGTAELTQRGALPGACARQRSHLRQRASSCAAEWQVVTPKGRRVPLISHAFHAGRSREHAKRPASRRGGRAAADRRTGVSPWAVPMRACCRGCRATRGARPA
jgi:hypothetical protein